MSKSADHNPADHNLASDQDSLSSQAAKYVQPVVKPAVETDERAPRWSWAAIAMRIAWASLAGSLLLQFALFFAMAHGFDTVPLMLANGQSWPYLLGLAVGATIVWVVDLGFERPVENSVQDDLKLKK